MKTTRNYLQFITVCGNDDSIVFGIVTKFLLLVLLPNKSWTAALTLMEFCMCMYFDNQEKFIKF